MRGLMIMRNNISIHLRSHRQKQKNGYMECGRREDMPDIRVLPDINGTGFGEMLSFLKECVGIMEGSDSRGEGMVGDMIIFSENAWICDGIPSFDPVYVYYESCAGEVKHIIFLRMWSG